MATKTWNAASASNWNTAGNWLGGLPAANDDLVFNAASATTAVFTGYVLGMEISAQVDSAVKASVTIEITGAVTWV